MDLNTTLMGGGAAQLVQILVAYPLVGHTCTIRPPVPVAAPAPRVPWLEDRGTCAPRNTDGGPWPMWWAHVLLADWWALASGPMILTLCQSKGDSTPGPVGGQPLEIGQSESLALNLEGGGA